LASIQPPPSPTLGRHFSASVRPSPSTHRRHPFSLDFLPGGVSTWEIADSRGGLLHVYRGVHLYDQLGSSSAAASRQNVPGLVVCDPLRRRYTPIPCPRDQDGQQYLGLFLLDGGRTGQPAGSDDRIGISSLRVMVALHRPHTWEPGRGMPVACVFSTGRRGAGDWHVVKRAWRSGGIDIPCTIEPFYFGGRAHGSFYWGIKGSGGAGLVLDEATAGFSMAMLPEMMLGSSYDLPVRPPVSTDDLAERSAVDDQDDLYTRNNAVAVARTCAEYPGSLLLLLLSLDRQD